MFKPVLLLTTLLFLMVAPAPDATDISQMTAGLLVLDQPAALMAADEKHPD